MAFIVLISHQPKNKKKKEALCRMYKDTFIRGPMKRSLLLEETEFQFPLRHVQNLLRCSCTSYTF